MTPPRSPQTVPEVLVALRETVGDDPQKQLEHLAAAYLESQNDASSGFQRRKWIEMFGLRLAEKNSGAKSSAREAIE